MKDVYQTSQFKDLERIRKRGKDLDKIKEVIRIIADDGTLQERYRDHPLTGKWSGSRDCHIEPDWVLIYRADEKTLFLERTGTHSDLFKK